MDCIVHEVTKSQTQLRISLSGPYSSSLGGENWNQMYVYIYMYKIYQNWLHAHPYPYQPEQCSIYTMKYEDCHCKTTR